MAGILFVGSEMAGHLLSDVTELPSHTQGQFKTSKNAETWLSLTTTKMQRSFLILNSLGMTSM